jgi:hypothetical protein
MQSNRFFDIVAALRVYLHLNAIGIVATILLIYAPSGAAEDGTVMRLPVVGRTRFPSGLQMEVDTRWVEAQGYRPIRIKLGTLPAAPALADRTIRVDIKTFYRNSHDEVPDVTTAYITLPEGKTSVTTTVLVLQEALWNRVDIETYEGSAHLLDMSTSSGASASARRANVYNGWDQDAISFLIVDANAIPRSLRSANATGNRTVVPGVAAGTTPPNPSTTIANEVPDIRNLALQVPDPVASYNIYAPNTVAPNVADDPGIPLTDSQLMDWLATRSNFELLPPSEVPSRWLELTGFDFLIISLEDLQILGNAKTRQLEAIRKWVRSGGNLLVYGANAEGQAQINSLLNEVNPAYAWAPVAASNRNTNLDFVTESTSSWRGEELPKIAISKDKPTTSYFTVVARPSGFGFVAAIAEPEVFPGTRRQWTALINSIPSWRSLWSARNGVSLSNSNSDSFWLFAIPGFGMAPVMLFVGLITVFVIVLGPINYAWLKRRSQLSMLIFTVPLGALITILSLSLYAILGDGLYTRLRIWSVTDLDQRTGVGSTISHQTYYAGIPPWSGLQFPSDAAVYPVDQLPERMGFYNNREMRRAPRATRWDETQQLQRGFIASRTLSQFVVMFPIATEAQLLVQEGKITNQLGVKLEHLVVRGDDETLLYAKSVEPHATAVLRPLDEPTQESIKELFAQSMPQLMEGFDNYAYTTAMTGSNRMMRFGINGRTYSAVAEGDGILLESLKQFEDSARVKVSLPQHTYIAVVEKSPFAPQGTTAIELMSFHVIRGRW